MPALRSRVASVFILFGLAQAPTLVEAQEIHAPPDEEPRSAAPVRRFFERPIDYWQRGLSYPEDPKLAPQGSPPGKPDPGRKPSEWGQIVKQSDGTVAYQELPRPLVDVLEDP